METPDSLTPDEQQALQNELNGRCKDCRWWNAQWCEEARFPEYRHCIQGNAFHQPEPKLVTDPLYAECDDEYGEDTTILVRIFTAPDFGCVSWTAKKTTCQE